MRTNLAVSENPVPLATGLDVRLAARSGALDAQTAGLAPGFVQANLAILPHELCGGFPALLPGQSEAVSADRRVGAGRSGASRRSAPTSTSAPTCRATASGATASSSRSRAISVRLARRSGQLRARLLVLVRGGAARGGCPGAPHRARRRRADVSHQYRDCSAPGGSTGRWSCRCGRSSRRDAIRAVQITTPLPAVHGAPVHIGYPAQIGIADLAKPDYGDPVPVGRARCRCSGRAG